jgi:hypothetical protein
MRTTRAMNPYTKARMESALLRLRERRERLEKEANEQGKTENK